MAARGNARRNANGQGGVYLRADGRWEAKVFVDTPDGRRKRISVYGDSQRDALDELGKVLDQQRRGIPIATTTLTVAEYMKYWLQHIAEPSIRRTTYATYEGDVRLAHRPGHRQAKAEGLAGSAYSDMAEPTADDVPVLRPGQGLRPTKTPRCCAMDKPTVLSGRSIVQFDPAHPQSLAGGLAGRRRRRATQPKRRATRPTAGDRRPQGSKLHPCRSASLPGDRGEAQALRAVGGGAGDGTAPRRGAGARLGRCRSRAGSTNDPTGASPGRRRTPIGRSENGRVGRRTADSGSAGDHSARTPQTAARRTVRCRLAVARDGLGVHYRRTAASSNRAMSNRMFHDLCEMANVPQLRVHDLRHSCATLLFTMGVTPATVQRILRHSSITVTTGTYVEVIEAVQRDALDSMGSLFAHVGDGSTSQLSSKTSPLSSKLSSNGSE